MKNAVCVLIPITPVLFVAISRRDDTEQWGIPGGKVDAGETCEQAIKREAKEELNIDIDMRCLVPIYSGVCPGEVTYWVTTYLYDRGLKLEDMTPEEGLTITEMHMLSLCDPEISPFANYNREVFAALSSWSME